MNIIRRSSSILIGLFCTAAALAAPPVAYKATLLHPLSGFAVSNANGVSGDFQVGEAYGPATGNNFRALLWNSTAESVIDLTPPGANSSIAYDIEGNTQVGVAGTAGPTESFRATIWHGTPNSAISLHPAGFWHSDIRGLSGSSQVGNGYVFATADSRALLWHGSAASVVSLHPAGFQASTAEDVDGDTNSQVGWGNFIDSSSIFRSHALLWHGTAASVTDLHPAEFSHSQAYAVSENIQVGYGQLDVNGGPTRALLWHGSADNYVNLHPAGFDYSYARGVAGDLQVGFGTLSGGQFLYRAVVWNGTAESAVNLHSTLADLPIQLVHSFADKIDASGNIVGHGRDSANRDYAILWTPIPEPATTTLLLISVAMLGAAGSRCRV